MWRRGRTHYLVGVLTAVATLFIAGCGAEPTPPRLVHFSPAVLLVPTEEAITVRVIYERNDFELTSFAWAVEAGDIEGDGTAEIVYTAPGEPGDYQISVTAAYGEGEEAGEQSLDGVIKVIPGTSRLVAEVAGEPDQSREAPAAEESTGPEVATSETAPQDGEDSPDGDANQPDDSPGSDQSAAPGPAAGSAAEEGSRLDRILAEKQLTAAVQISFRPFSFSDDDGKRVGFDVDLVREFARRWLDDPTAATLVPVPSAERIPTLLAGEVDIVAAALTKTPARAELVDFSLTYFKDGQRLLVAEGSEIASVCDLASQPVAAIADSTSLDNLKQQAAVCGFELNDNLVVFESHADALAALLDGQVAAFTSDGVALESFAAGQPLKVVGNHFSEEPYGIAVPKGDQRLKDAVDATLKAMADDGTYAAIYERWFGDAIAPYPLEEVELTTDPAELEPLVETSAPPLFEPRGSGPEAIAEYVVEAGDTLSKIAGRVYGDVSPTSWQRIYEANRELIGDDPSRIEVGMTLAIPR
jgi:polar amino acid transport system substrate-binding protein